MPTLGVVIPTKNSRPLLPLHVEALLQWIDLADEVVVVDSFSDDDTVDYLRNHLTHPGLRFLTHPPGLYESWNFGLQSLTTDFAYVSTIGDTITRDGVVHLSDTMAALEADVVLSKPTLTSESGAGMGEWELPLDLILKDHGESEPFRLKFAEMAVYAAVFSDGGLLGSSASNLYRTTFMQEHPFPADHGPAGDGVWAAAHVFDAFWAVTPLQFSTFMLHACSHSQPRQKVRLDRTLQCAVQTALSEGKLDPEWIQSVGIRNAVKDTAAWLHLKEEFDVLRKGAWPWILNPYAWRVRYRRQSLRKRLSRWKAKALVKLNL